MGKRDLKRELQSDYARNLQCLRTKKKYHDVYLLYPNSNEPIPSVKTLLASQSQFFIDVFFGTGIEQNDADNQLKLTFSDEIPLEMFKILHNYIFSMKLDIEGLSPEQQFHIFRLANFYQFEDIREYLVQYFISIMFKDNCWSFVNLAAEFDETRLADACAEYISKYVPNISQNLNFLELNIQSLAFLFMRDTLNLPENDIYKAARAWCENNPNVDATILKESIRLSLAPEEMHEEMKEWGIVADDRKRYRLVIPKEKITEKMNDYENLIVLDSEGNNIPVRVALANNIPLETTVTLSDVFRINHITMKFSAAMKIQYSLEVSADRCDWICIVDYDDNICHGIQEIYFEPQSFKYIKIVARNLVRTRIPPGISEKDPSSSLLIMNIESFSMEYAQKEMMKSMTAPIKGYLIPNYNIAPFCVHTDADATTVENLAVANAKIEEKYRRLFRGNMDKSNGGIFSLHLTQPCLISHVKFLIYDRPSGQTGIKRTYFYEIGKSLDNKNWETLAVKNMKKEGYVGLQEITFDPPQVMSFIRIVPTRIFNFNVRKIFSIVDIQIFGSFPGTDNNKK